MIADPLLYGAFAAIVAVLLAVDLFVVQRNAHEVSLREAAVWSGIWIGVSCLFGAVVARFHTTTTPGGSTTVEFFTGYVVEKALSVDNVFLFVVIFAAFGVPRAYQHRVLFYGVLGAIAMRTALVFTGAALIQRFEWVLAVFGAFLLFVAYRTWRARDAHPAVGESKVVTVVRRVVPTTDGFRGSRFVVREGGRWLATPLFVVLVLVEFTDLVFAVDSIPAIFAITRDPFIVLTSNVLAILGLRSLYFLLAGLADRLRYLKIGLAVILAYVGLKLLTEPIEGIYHPTPLQSLFVIAVILTVVTVSSLIAGPPAYPPVRTLPFTPSRPDLEEPFPPAGPRPDAANPHSDDERGER